VIDQTTVTPVSRPDEDIRKDILTALLQDPATESYQVAVSVQDAVATLTGTVGSYAEKQLAAMIAKGVKGIKAVNIDVTITIWRNAPTRKSPPTSGIVFNGISGSTVT